MFFSVSCEGRKNVNTHLYMHKTNIKAFGRLECQIDFVLLILVGIVCVCVCVCVYGLHMCFHTLLGVGNALSRTPIPVQIHCFVV